MPSTEETYSNDFQSFSKIDPLIFEKLFKNYYTPLRNYCQGIVMNKLDIKTTIQTYLYSTVRHGALHYLKKQMLERTHLPRLAEFIIYLQESEYSEEELIKLEEAKKILQELPEQCRIVFVMNCMDGKKYKDIAEELNISVNTVKTHLSKAYRKFREN